MAKQAEALTPILFLSTLKSEAEHRDVLLTALWSMLMWHSMPPVSEEVEYPVGTEHARA